MSIFDNLRCFTSLLKSYLVFSCSSSVLTLLICMMVMLLPVIPLPTCVMLPLLYSVHTFQFLIFMMFLGCTRGLFSCVVFCWFCTCLSRGHSYCEDQPQCSLDKGNFLHFWFRNRVLQERVISPQPNSKPGGPKSSLYPLTCLAWVTLPGVKDSSQHSSMDQQDTELNHSTTVRWWSLCSLYKECIFQFL